MFTMIATFHDKHNKTVVYIAYAEIAGGELNALTVIHHIFK